jgi:hypothetical protein
VPKALVKELRDTKSVDEYIVGVRRQQSLVRQLTGKREQAQCEAHELGAHVFVDRELGRGQSHFFVPPGAQLRPLIQQSALRALRALGPAWRLRPPSAPARLAMVDTDWAENLFRASDGLWEQFQAHQPSSLRLLDGSLQLTLVDTRAILSNGFDNQYRSTELQLEAWVQATGGLPIAVTLRARRQEDLRWQALFEDAERRSLQSSAASANPGGACDLLLLSSAYLPRAEDDFGLWTPLVHQCDANLAASGLARYRVGQEILRQPARGELLSVRSDGTRPFALRSAPFDAEGQAVRRFSVIADGLAAGQSVGYRDAARLGIEGNGGVRNLVIDSGKQGLEELGTPGARPLLVVHSLSDLHAEARGTLCLRVADSELRVRDAGGLTQTQATRGGVLSGNLYDWLQDARFSSEREDLLWLEGPKAIRFNQLELRV